MPLRRSEPPVADALPSGLAPGLPPRAGVGLKAQHYAAILEGQPEIGFFEVHAENYMGAGGPPHRYLEAIAERYPLSLHGVGLSIGGAGPLDAAHLARLRALNERYKPAAFSEHLAWSSHGGAFLNDLLPLPYDADTLNTVAEHVDAVQQALGRQMLLENPATYVTFAESTVDETDFIAGVTERSGCGLLLDVNNVMVSAVNHGFDPYAYIDRFPVEQVGEIHLAGYDETKDATGARLLIDAHGSTVRADVVALYRHALERTGPVATLIEWDNDVPDWTTLLAEAERAEAVMGEVCRCHGAGLPLSLSLPLGGSAAMGYLPVKPAGGGDAVAASRLSDGMRRSCRMVPSPLEGEGQGEGWAMREVPA